MSQKLERDFAKKLKQRKKERLQKGIGAFFLGIGVVAGFGYLFHQGILSLNQLSLFIFGLILIFGLMFYIIKNKKTKKYLEFLQIGRLGQIKKQYLLGFALLFIALVYQANPSSLTNPINNFITGLKYNPSPPIADSSWRWNETKTIHPVVANMPSKVETSIQSVAEYIAQRETDPYLRIQALHDYVVSRVTYDLEVLTTGIRPAQDAQTVFEDHKGVCEGYANLFMALGKAIDLDVVFVGGRVRRDFAPIDLIPKHLRLFNSNYDWTLHAWNAVKVSDHWQLVDTTWDDGDSGSPYRADYLMPPPEVMIVSHLPEQANWQLLHHSKDRNTFEKQPILAPQFFAEGLVLLSPTEYEINVDKVASIKIKSPPNYQKKLGAISIEESKSSFWELPNFRNSSDSEKQKMNKCKAQQNPAGEVELSCQFPKPGTYQILMFSLGQEISPIGQLKFHAV